MQADQGSRSQESERGTSTPTPHTDTERQTGEHRRHLLYTACQHQTADSGIVNIVENLAVKEKDIFLMETKAQLNGE